MYNNTIILFIENLHNFNITLKVETIKCDQSAMNHHTSTVQYALH